MARVTIRSKLSIRTSALVVVSFCLVVATIEIHAVRAKELAANPPRRMDAAYCVKCHSDAKTIRTMRMKEDGANFLFNPDGTFKDPKFAALNSSHHNGAYGAPPK